MKEFIIKYYLQVLMGLSITFIGACIKKLKQNKKDSELIKDGICALQRNSLLKSCEDYQNRGWCSIQAKSTLNDLYKSYHNLGGDTFITEMVRQVNNLPNEKPNHNDNE